VVADAQQLGRSEVALARAEVREEIARLQGGLVALAAGGAVAATGGLLLVVALVRGLSAATGWPLWASYLGVGVVMLAVGLVLLQQARTRMTHLDPVPHETIESVRKDVRWIREQAR
jgi:hypothetical protein